MAGQVKHTYTGYGDKTDDAGKIVSTGTEKIVETTAADANQYVDPKEVAEAIKNLKSVLGGAEGGITRIKKALENVSVDADGNMLKVEDATMEPVIKEGAESLDTILPSLESEFDQIQEFAQKEHDDKQIEYNEEAKETVTNTPGVTKVVQS